MFDRDLFGDDVKPDAQGSVLAQTWEYPPFSVLNAREGWWQERKRQWLALGIKSELGRGGELIPNGGGQAANKDMMAGGGGQSDGGGVPKRGKAANLSAPGGSARPACNYSKQERGDGKGRAI